MRIQLLQQNQVLTHRKRHPLHGCRVVLDDVQFIAIAKIQGVDSFRFWIRDKGVAPCCQSVCFREWSLPAHIIIDTVQNFIQRVSRPQPVETEEPFRAGWLQSRVLQWLSLCRSGFNGVAHCLHCLQEVLLCRGCQNCPINIRTDNATNRWLSILFRSPFVIGFPSSFWIANHRKTIFAA